MSVAAPQFVLLNPELGWRDRAPRAVSAGATSSGLFGLRLGTVPEGGLGLNAPDGSVGGLLLPAGVAIDGAYRTYLLDVRTARADLLAFDFDERRFRPLPGGSEIPLPTGSVRNEGCLAVAGDRLYLGFRRAAQILVYDLRRQIFLTPLDVREADGLAGDTDALRVTDIHTDGVDLYVLDADRETILVLPHAAGDGRSALRTMVANYERPRGRRGRARRLLVDRAGALYLMYPPYGDDKSILTPINAGGRLVSPYPQLRGSAHRGDGAVSEPPLIFDSNAVRPLFPTPAIRLSEEGLLVLPPELTAQCERRFPAVPPPPEDPLQILRTDRREACLVFDRHGEPASPPPAMRPKPRLYATEGMWISEALDSRHSDCQWHRIEVELERMPNESSISVSTFATDEVIAGDHIVGSAANPVPENEFVWATDRTIHREDTLSDPEHGLKDEFLIQSRGGRYLWIRIKLHGDGHRTPVVKAVRVHYPRDSYLNRLPHIFRDNVENRWFLDRFLSVFKTTWDDLHERVRAKPQLASPASVPDGAPMAFLGAMVGLKFDANLNAAGRRKLLETVPATYPMRGTAGALHTYLTACLSAVSGRPTAVLRPLLSIVEGFRVRNRILLDQGQTGGLGDGGTLWGADIMNRAQLDRGAVVGRSELLHGDARTDLFRRYANRMAVYVPAALVDTPEKERVLRNAIEAEKPAHVDCCLCLVEPALRLGFQSTLGVDTIVGERPLAHMLAAEPDRSGMAGSRLGVDTVIGDSDGERPL